MPECQVTRARMFQICKRKHKKDIKCPKKQEQEAETHYAVN